MCIRDRVYSVSLTPNSTNNTTTKANAESTPGQLQNATAGTIVYYPYTLTNTGNAPDTYFITTKVGDATTGTATGTLGTAVNGNKKVYLDVNGNGAVDVGDTLIADGAATPTLSLIHI